MPIMKPSEMDFSQKKIVMIISGLPGTWKTTLAFSAPEPLLCDFDEGLARIKPEHRKDASICKTYEEFLADIKAAKGHYQTIIIDTTGALIECMKDWAMRTDPKASKKDGGFSLQGYGVIKSEFLRLSAELRKEFNVIFLFHENMTKNGDDGVFYELVVEGSARTLVYQPADLAAHLFIQNGRHYLGFTPTEQYSAKSAYGIKGLIEVPELNDGDPNDFLTKLFVKVRQTLHKEKDEFGPTKDAYEDAMERAKEIVDGVTKPEDVALAAKSITGLTHALTSEKEAKAMLKAKLAELNIVWDKSTRTYRYAE